MRHRKSNVRFGRSPEHRAAMVASLVGHLIERHRIKTTLPKARQARMMAERMVTLGKAATLASRRRALAVLPGRKQVDLLFAQVAPRCKDRQGGYTRIIKLGRRASDSSEMAYLEWVDAAVSAEPTEAATATEAKAE